MYHPMDPTTILPNKHEQKQRHSVTLRLFKSDFTDKDESNLQEFELQKYFNDMLVY